MLIIGHSTFLLLFEFLFSGIGWTQANPAVGTVYFTLNGTVLNGEQTDIPAGLFPVVHILKKVIYSRRKNNYQKI